MTAVELTNLLIGIVIGLITYVSKRMIDKMDQFEKAIQQILISDVSKGKDIESIKVDLADHETRISKLEETN
jgi:hypothetical protein